METIICERTKLQSILKRMQLQSRCFDSLLNCVEVSFLEEDWKLANTIGDALAKNIAELNAILNG
jgi:hypothetical protein